MRETEFKVRPVGFVKRSGEEARVEILEEYSGCLDRIECFSHLVLLYWMDKVPEDLRRVRKIKPLCIEAPVLGVFATRFPARPNPIGLTVVKLLSRSGNVLIVEGLDAEEGTPILDVKPYIPLYDKPKGRVRLPQWVKRHLRRHSHCHDSTFEELLGLVKLLER